LLSLSDQHRFVARTSGSWLWYYQTSEVG
jgi:hypothetical protein